jgi:hypothetical protein
MPATSWDNLALCTVADVRKRISSPEIIIQLNKASDVRIAVVAVNTTADLITTGIPHGFTPNTQINFENTGGALPAPLVPNTTYYVCNPTSTSFQVTSLLGGLPIDLTTAGSGVTAVYNSTLSSAIQQKIDLTKDWIYQALQLELQRRIPLLVSSWTAYKRWQTMNLTQGMSRDVQLLNRIAGLGDVGGLIFDGTTFDLYFLLSFGLDLKPSTFSMQGAPQSGLSGSFANLAQRGDMLIDTQANALYINRGTSASPSWQTPTVELILDNLLNPSVLVHAAVDYTLWAMAQDGMFRNRVNYDEGAAAGFMVDSESMWRKNAKARLNEVIPLLKLDLDGSGNMGDFEASLVSGEIAAFG